jgi:hypothetical protein
MFCPQCGSTQPDDLRFCKSCGANLQALRQIMATRETDEKFDWSKTWVAEMFMSSEEAVKRAAEIERLQGKTPEVKRRNEIKAGVITGSVGLGLMLLLLVLMEGIIASGRVSEAAAAILSRLWIVGIIPLLVGVALIVNGVFVSKRSDAESAHRADTDEPEAIKTPDFLPPADTSQFSGVPFSVTDQTTRHLEEPVPARRKAANKE